jgi:hypothetical protein
MALRPKRNVRCVLQNLSPAALSFNRRLRQFRASLARKNIEVQ